MKQLLVADFYTLILRNISFCVSKFLNVDYLIMLLRLFFFFLPKIQHYSNFV